MSEVADGVGAAADVIVRDAVRADLGALAELYVQLGGVDTDAAPARGRRGVAILDAMLTTPGRSLLVAELAGTVVGTADMLVIANLTHGGRPWTAVENVVVHEGARGAGVGRLLMEEVVRRSRAAGAYKVQLLSRRHRTGAHAFYRRLGFGDSAEGFRLYLE